MSQVPPKVREAVRERCGGLCEFPGCRAHAEHLHHRKMRSQGGSNSADNLLAVCYWHHEHIHANPSESYENGWLVHSWDVA